MKKILLLVFLFPVAFSYSQISKMFYIADGNDDVNEVLSSKPVFNSEYLKLGRGPAQEVLRIGLRYQDVTIPKGSEIVSAYIQFTSSHDSEDSVYMKIVGEKSPDAAPFDDAESEIYLRPATSHAVYWGTKDWQNFIPGPDQRTPDLKEIIQEIIDQDEWVGGNAMHIKMYNKNFGDDLVKGLYFISIQGNRNTITRKLAIN